MRARLDPGSWVSSVLAVIALILTVSGVYSVMSFLAGQKTREIGVRVALGATRSGVVEHMVRHSGRLVAAGLGAGAILALWGAKLIALRTPMIDTYDAIAYGIAMLAVGAAAMVASMPPAIRASQTNPVEALRLEGS